MPPPASPQLALLAGSVGGAGSLDGPASLSRLSGPCAVAADALGNRFVADTVNCTIRKLGASGELLTLAGRPGRQGSADGKGSSARFAFPRGLAADGKGGVFVADSENHTIRHVDADGLVTTLAGLAGQPGTPGAALDVPLDGAAARFTFPEGLAFDGTRLFIADRGNHAIRVLTADKKVSLFAGSANGIAGNNVLIVSRSEARFRNPLAIALAADGTFWIADHGNSRVRKVNGNLVRTSTGGPGTDSFLTPVAIAVDPASGEGLVFSDDSRLYRVSSDLFAAQVTRLSLGDSGNSDGPLAQATFRVGLTGLSSGGLAFDPTPSRQSFLVADAGNDLLREIAASMPGQPVATLAGQRAAQSGSVNGQGAAARFSAPRQIAISQDDGILISDTTTQGGVVRRVTPGGLVSQHLDPQADLDLRSLAEAASGRLYIGANETMRIHSVGQPDPLDVGKPGATILDGPPSLATFGSIFGVAVDSLGRAVVADMFANAVRRVTPAGVVSRVAGQYGAPGFQGGDALDSARFDSPIDVAVAPDDSIYVVDAGNRAVLRIVPGALGRDQVQVVAAGLDDPRAIALDPKGNLYIAEGTLSTIVRITPGGERKTVVGVEGQRGFMPGAMPGALGLPPKSGNAEENMVGLRVSGDRLLLTMDRAIVQIQPLPT